MKFCLALLFVCSFPAFSEEESSGNGLRITEGMRAVWKSESLDLKLHYREPPPLWEKVRGSKVSSRGYCKTQIRTAGSLVTIMKLLEGDHTNLGVGLKYFFRVRIFYC
jgi:hypothetical protein